MRKKTELHRQPATKDLIHEIPTFIEEVKKEAPQPITRTKGYIDINQAAVDRARAELLEEMRKETGIAQQPKQMFDGLSTQDIATALKSAKQEVQFIVGNIAQTLQTQKDFTTPKPAPKSSEIKDAAVVGLQGLSPAEDLPHVSSEFVLEKNLEAQMADKKAQAREEAHQMDLKSRVEKNETHTYQPDVMLRARRSKEETQQKQRSFSPSGFSSDE